MVPEPAGQDEKVAGIRIRKTEVRLGAPHAPAVRDPPFLAGRPHRDAAALHDTGHHGTRGDVHVKRGWLADALMASKIQLSDFPKQKYIEVRSTRTTNAKCKKTKILCK